jgi:hypothetical protein
MTCRLIAAAALLALAGPAAAQGQLTVKVEDAPPPAELSAPVRALLDSKAMTVSDDKGAAVLTVWPRKVLESKAAADKAASGLTYLDLPETVLVGAVRFAQTFTDFRKQKVKPGVYTLRLSNQPMDGDHMGTAPYNEFLLLAHAGQDQKPELMEIKALHEMSSNTTSRKHPGVVLLFPNAKPADAPKIEPQPNDIQVLTFKVPATAGGQKAAMGIGMVVVGVTMAE